MVHRFSPRASFLYQTGLCGLLLVGLASAVRAGDAPGLPQAPREALPAAVEKDAPASLADLKAIQTHVQKVLARVVPATVGLRIGPAQGSGVIISADGYVLTAGHVSGEADRDVTIVLHDGRRVRGKTLGANRGIDSGMVKITDEGKWPHMEMADSEELKKGQWVLAIGHPGGYKPGRTPVVRLGRILDHTASLIRTDCTLVGGDSGGPLFDMHGRVIGIHSRISGPITANIHVPVNTYRDTWGRLAKGEVWGGFLTGARPADAYMGVQLEPEEKGCRVAEVVPDSPAAKAGLKVDDILDSFEGKKISSIDDLVDLLRRKKPGDRVVLEVVRSSKSLKIEMTLGKREES